MASLPSSFPPDLQQFVDAQIAAGKYVTASDVVCDAVRQLRDREQRLGELRHEIDRGLSQLDAGDCIELESENDIQEFLDDLKLRGQQRLSAQQGG